MNAMAVAGTKLSPRDCKDLEKYLRYLVYKSVQVIVQSRQGDKISVPSKQFSTGVDWFSLTIRDSPDVLAEVKRVYPGSGNGLISGETVCLETVLRMNNSESIQLETWYIKMSPDVDATARISFTVYSRIGTLLKSLLVTSRSLPVYRLSRKYTDIARGCSVCYRVYVGEPVFELGSFYRNQLVGLVPTPIGTVSLSVGYRTQLSFGSNHQEIGCLEVREDHFSFDQKAVSNSIHIPCRQSNSTYHQDDADLTSLHSLPLVSPSTPDTRKDSPTHLAGNQPDACNIVEAKSVTSKTDTLVSEPVPPNKTDTRLLTDLLTPISDSVSKNASSCKPFGRSGAEPPPVSEVQVKIDPVQEGNVVTGLPSNFLPVDQKEPSDAKGNKDLESDLGKFYRECRSAPALSMFQQPSGNLQDLLTTISDQLAQFEANAKEFDDFVNSFPEC